MVRHAVLIDTVSIQKYVFGSNKLKENLGASFLIQEVYRKYLQKVIVALFPSHHIDFEAWKAEPAKYLIADSDTSFEVGYIGGGNALLFFKENSEAVTFIKEWTKELLMKAPGIVTAVVCAEFDTDSLNNSESTNSNLFRNLQENKYKYIPQTIIPRHGITAECPHTGYSMDVWNNDKAPENEKDYVSCGAYAKIVAAKEATDTLNEEFKEELKNGYCFTDQLDKLGQRKNEDSHIAIVHIDGNGMGQRFRTCKTLKNVRDLSKTVEEATKNSIRALISEITTNSNFRKIEFALGYDEKNTYPVCENDNKKKMLPLRPIIIGGDDITFVCDGRLGIYFAKIFMESFEKQHASDGQKLTSCAGVAITKTKYPFYRGYILSEELCRSAKEKRKEEKDKYKKEDSWLDFHISFGGFSGSLKDIRSSGYKSAQGELLFRPYKIGNKDEYGLDTFIENTRMLKSELPHSKIKEMRQVLTLGKEATLTFVNEITSRGKGLPVIAGKSCQSSLFEGCRTPYFDMIELMEFYPSFELETGKGEE